MAKIATKQRQKYTQADLTFKRKEAKRELEKGSEREKESQSELTLLLPRAQSQKNTQKLIDYKRNSRNGVD